MRKFIVSVVVALVVLCGAIFNVYETNNVNETYESKEINNDSNMLSMMLEISAGSGKYQETTRSSWPEDGYVFNETLSKCENGSSLSWDNTNKNVVMKGNVSDKCYVYFDKKLTLAEYVMSLYKGTQGQNNLYLHDSTLTNGAGDNSYRYAGSSETTNNFVCFGYDSKDGSCSTDNLYRIIGIFGGQVKLIKYDYANSDLLGTDGESASGNEYYWNKNTNINKWSESKLNAINLNTNFINNIGDSWSNLIDIHTWKISGNSWANMGSVVVSTSYKNEITTPEADTTYDAKIGLMYVSDYGYAASPSAWLTVLSENDEGSNDYGLSSITSVNWMYMKFSEWTISPLTNFSNGVYEITKNGDVGSCVFYGPDRASYSMTNDQLYIRPVFYLNSSVTYVSGKGTKTEPIIIN